MSNYLELIRSAELNAFLSEHELWAGADLVGNNLWIKIVSLDKKVSKNVMESGLHCILSVP